MICIASYVKIEKTPLTLLSAVVVYIFQLKKPNYINSKLRAMK